jgi:hypothetical protein
VKIESVTPSRPYAVVTPNGNVTFYPGNVLRVSGIRISESMEFLTVMGLGLRFEIPAHVTTTLSEMELA